MRFVEGEVRVLGNRKSPRVHEIKDFLARSRIPFLWFDVESDEKARAVAEEIAPGEKRWPIVLFPDGTKLIEPTVRDVAAKLGLDTEPDSTCWDLIVVGGGPAGVSASIYGGSEGLRTLVVEQGVPGGQASYGEGTPGSHHHSQPENERADGSWIVNLIRWSRLGPGYLWRAM